MVTPIEFWQESAGFPLLTSMSLIPFAGMIAVWHARTIAWARGLSIGTALLNILLTILLLTLFDHGKREFNSLNK